MTTKDRFQVRDFFKFNYKGFAYIVANYRLNIPKSASSLDKNTQKLMKDMSNWWCGYVILTSASPHYGKSYDDIDILAHGGLTYSGLPPNAKEGFAIGFDMNHTDDKGGSKEKTKAVCKDIINQLK